MSKRTADARAAYLARERPGELVQVAPKPKTIPKPKPKPKPKPPPKPKVRRGPYRPRVPTAPEPEPEPVRAPDAPELSPGGSAIHCPFRHDGDAWYFPTWGARAQHLRTEHGWR